MLCFAVSLFTASRAYAIGFLTGGFFLLSLKYPTPKIKLSAFLAFVICLVICYHLKYDSSLGRMLIYKISFNILKDHYLTGAGFRQFKMLYLHYQAKYFASGHFTIKELLLADNVQYALNDYLQFIIEFGVAGMIMLLVYFLWIISLIKKACSGPAKNSLLFLCALVVFIAISVAAFFNYVYYRPVCQVLFLVSVAVIIYYAYFHYLKKQIRFYIPVCCIAISAFICSGNDQIIHYKACSELKDDKDLLLAGFKTEALTNFARLYPILKHDPDYLLFYGGALLNSGYTDTALHVLTEAGKLVSYNTLYGDIGKCNYLTGKIKEAEAAYILSVNMVPNRFESRYKLYNFYKDIGQRSKALNAGKAILSLPVKIKSNTIDFIKSSVAGDLKQSPL